MPLKMQPDGIVALFALTWLLIPDAGAQTDQKAAEYEIHEWGVFTAPRDALWLKQDMAAEWSSFPEFFQGVWPKKKIAYRGPVTKPVVFFHTNQKMTIQFEIQFAKGRPLIWWPPAEWPNDGAPWVRSLSDNGKIEKESFLQFRIQTNEGLGKQRAVAKDHWLNKLRKVKSASIMTYGSQTNFRSPSQTHEQESFLYYDGLMQSPTPPRISRDGANRLQLSTDSDHDWMDVVLIERYQGAVFVSEDPIEKIAKGKNRTPIQMREIEAGQIEGLKKKLHEQLVRAGLNRDESQSLMEVWGEGLFEKQGLTLFYRVPQKTYEEWLPVHAVPKPKQKVRVGLVVHYHLEPELATRIEQRVRDLASRDFRVRDRADRQLREVGGPAFELIRKASQDADPEVRLRCRKILKLQELEEQMKQLMKKYSKN